MRLNRRVLRIIGGTLVVVVLAGLVTLHAQGSRLSQVPPLPASRLPAPAGERWFDKIPDRAPASTEPAPALPLAGTPPAQTLTDAEFEAQRRERELRAAMAAPIPAAAFGARFVMLRGAGAERSATGTETGQPPAAIVPAAASQRARPPPGVRRRPHAPRAPPPDRPELFPGSLHAVRDERRPSPSGTSHWC